MRLRQNLFRFGLAVGVFLTVPAIADIKGLLEMSEQLDAIEQQDFNSAIDKANNCTGARDFACTNAWLAKAAKLAGNARDKQRLALARQNMANEKARIAEEERLRAEEQRRIAEAEERLRLAEAEAARRASEADEPSTGMQLFKLGAAIAGNVYAEKARLAAAAANTARSPSAGLPLADLTSQRLAIEKARAEAAARNNAAAAQATARAAPQSALAAAAPQAQVFYSASRESCPPGFYAVQSAGGTGTACAAEAPKPVRQTAAVDAALPVGAKAASPTSAAVARPGDTSKATTANTKIETTPLPSALAAKAEEAWRVCGPEKWCSAGDGLMKFCAGPPTGKRCKSECVMTSGVIYHDTGLPSDVAYIPSSERCEYPCDVRNSCS